MEKAVLVFKKKGGTNFPPGDSKSDEDAETEKHVFDVHSQNIPCHVLSSNTFNCLEGTLLTVAKQDSPPIVLRL